MLHFFTGISLCYISLPVHHCATFLYRYITVLHFFTSTSLCYISLPVHHCATFLYRYITVLHFFTGTSLCYISLPLHHCATFLYWYITVLHFFTGTSLCYISLPTSTELKLLLTKKHFTNKPTRSLPHTFCNCTVLHITTCTPSDNVSCNGLLNTIASNAVFTAICTAVWRLYLTFTKHKSEL